MGALLLLILVPIGGAAAAELTLPPEVAACVAEATRPGIPAAAVLDKAREGVAKGAAPGRVCTVVSGLADELERAAALVPAKASDREATTVAAAAALRAGVPEDVVADLAASSSAWAGAALQAYADLLGAGFTVAEAERLVDAALASADPASSLRGLSTSAALLLREGHTTADSVDILLESVSTGRGAHGRPADPGRSDPPSHANAGGSKK